MQVFHQLDTDCSGSLSQEARPSLPHWGHNPVCRIILNACWPRVANPPQLYLHLSEGGFFMVGGRPSLLRAPSPSHVCRCYARQEIGVALRRLGLRLSEEHLGPPTTPPPPRTRIVPSSQYLLGVSEMLLCAHVALSGC